MSPQMSLRIRGKEMGLCLQDPLASLNPVLTIGYQLIEFIRSHNNISSTEARERALKLLNHVHINNPERVLHLYPHELSGGMRQRVLLVMAIACNPKLLILDEPTSSLDVLTERSVINFILELKKEFNLTLLLISHNSDLITRTCNRVLVLSEGRVVEKM
jgi:peptide/nickel transport system ATP-binding protein